MKKVVIDLDCNPTVASDTKLVRNIKGGKFEWNPSKIGLHFSNESLKKGFKPEKLRAEMVALSPLNFTMMSFLLRKENQHLIPKEWEEYNVYFWGTEFSHCGGLTYIHYITWSKRDGWQTYIAHVGEASLEYPHLAPHGPGAVFKK